MKIFKYLNFINERLGVADETLPYTNIVLDRVFEEFEEFEKSDKNDFEKGEIIDRELLSPIMSDRFPISEIKIDITFNRMSNDDFVKRFPTISSQGKHFTTTGVCYGIGDEDGSEELEDGTIMLVMGVGGIINKDKFNDIQSMKIELKSAIAHELNHSFEGYNRHRSGASGLSAALTSALDENVANVPENVWVIWWNEFGYYIYWTESFEINAMIQDAFPYAKKYSFEEFKTKAPSWDFYQRMFDFDPVNFKLRLIAEIEKTMPNSDPLEVLDKMKNGLAEALSKLLEEGKDEDGNQTEISSIDPKLIRSYSFDKFIEYCNRRIKKGSEKLRRGIIRHYSR